MINIRSVKPLDSEKLQELGFVWSDKRYDELVEVKESEAEAYYEAANELYDMYVEATDYVIDNDLFFELGIPFNLIDAIKKSWENDVHWHIYGRFDFIGGLDGKDIKLIGFDADTPTSLFETSQLQWELLKQNGIDEELQYNEVYEKISENFKRLITLFDDTSNFDERYDGWKILFSSLQGDAQAQITTESLQEMAEDAGFETGFEFLQDVNFNEDGIFDSEGEQYEYWFKFYPWEDIATDEPELATTLTNIMQNQNAIILNPAYTLLFKSKGMMKILYELFPDSPYLLKTSFEPLANTKHIGKPILGREGANTKILDSNGNIVMQNGGEYDNYKKVYQEYIEPNIDSKGDKYKTQVFFAYEACGLGFKRGSDILDEDSQFVGHVLV